MSEPTLPPEDERLRDLGIYDLARGVGALIELVSDVFAHLGSAVSQPRTPAARPINTSPPPAPALPAAPEAQEPRAGRPAEGAGQRGDARPGTHTYGDIGGLHRKVRRIREMVELPLR